MVADQILHLFEFFLLFIKMGTKIQWSQYSDFVKYLINSKKIPKNIKFDLHAHFNISIKLNGLDRPLGFCKVEIQGVAWRGSMLCIAC